MALLVCSLFLLRSILSGVESLVFNCEGGNCKKGFHRTAHCNTVTSCVPAYEAGPVVQEMTVREIIENTIATERNNNISCVRLYVHAYMYLSISIYEYMYICKFDWCCFYYIYILYFIKIHDALAHLIFGRLMPCASCKDKFKLVGERGLLPVSCILSFVRVCKRVFMVQIATTGTPTDYRYFLQLSAAVLLGHGIARERKQAFSWGRCGRNNQHTKWRVQRGRRGGSWHEIRGAVVSVVVDVRGLNSSDSIIKLITITQSSSRITQAFSCSVGEKRRRRHDAVKE